MKRFETITKAEQALNHLRRRLLTGVIAPGEKIPTERALVGEYGLSRLTINKITTVLVQEGLLERRGPKGTFVVGVNRRKATLQIGFLMWTSSQEEVNPVYEAILRSFVRASHAHPVLVSLGLMGGWGADLPRGFDAHGLDGLVLAGRCPPEWVEPFRQRDLPVLWLDDVDDSDRRHLIGTDNLKAGRLATEHLLQRGCRAILTLGYPRGYRGFDLRLEGYRIAHEAAGVPVDERRILRPYCPHAGHVVEILRKLEADGLRYDAVFGLSDMVGIWAIDALTRMGRKIPAEVAVIAVDGLPVGEWVRPKLTSVAQPGEEIGRCGFARILKQLEGVETDDGPELLAPRLIVRESA